MKNPFKTIAQALDKAIMGGDVHVIGAEEAVLQAAEPETLETDAVVDALEDTVQNIAVAEEAAAETAEEQVLAIADEPEGIVAGAGEPEGTVADASEPQGVANVVMGIGQVAVEATELARLRADAAKWTENATELENLRTWKANGGKANELKGAMDASDAVVAKVKVKVNSAQTQAAIDLQGKANAQRKKKA